MAIDMTPADLELLNERAAAVRASGALGQSASLLQLFDYLLDASREGRASKESEIAVAVFARAGAYNPAEDATVRVNVHRLRKKLEEFARAQGEAGRPYLILPKGEYRLMLDQPVPAEPDVNPPRPNRTWQPLLLMAAGLCIVCVVIAGAVWSQAARTESAIANVQGAQPWAALLANSRPTSIVVGDYIANVGDLRDDAPLPQGNHAMAVAQLMPIAIAPALQKVLPVTTVEGGRWGPPRTLAMSETTPDRIKLSNIVYVGFIGGMGNLRSPLARVSRLALHRPASLLERLPPSEAGAGVRGDLAYIASFPGPNENRIVIIAGFYDAGLIAAAEIATSPEALADIARRVGNKRDFEALFAVSAMDNTNVGSRPIFAAPLRADRIWNSDSAAGGEGTAPAAAKPR